MWFDINEKIDELGSATNQQLHFWRPDFWHFVMLECLIDFQCMSRAQAATTVFQHMSAHSHIHRDCKM